MNLAKSIFTIIIITMFSIMPVKAQQTGLFNVNLTFAGSSRVVSIYVPIDYDKNKSYQMFVGLHGLGHNSAGFADAWINQAQWYKFMPNTIWVFPDGGEDQNSDFYTPQGDEQFIMNAINYAKSNYNIDNNDIILEGFSLGGRSALKFGLDNPDLIKGLLLNTPAIQGGEDARNNPDAGVFYNYKNASKIPIMISQGGDDAGYLASVLEAHKLLVKNNGIVRRHIVAGMEHTIAIQNTNSYIQFLSNPTLGYDYNVSIFNVEAPNTVCSPNADMTVIIRNMGKQEVNKLNINYTVGTKSYSQEWTGTLGYFESKEIMIENVELNSTFNNVKFSVTSINGTQADQYADDENTQANITLQEFGNTSLLKFSFENNEFQNTLWQFNSSNSAATWQLDNTTATDGQNSLYMFNSLLYTYSKGSQEDLISPVMNLGKIKFLYFDVAYNYHHYSANYVGKDTDYTDTLEVSISTDCGETYTQLYKKFGAELATADMPILNALTLQNAIFTPTAKQWRRDVIGLEDYIGEESVMIKFSYISGQGGIIYLDDINFGTNLSVEENSINLNISPNPISDYTTITFDNESPSDFQLKITDISGKMIEEYKEYASSGLYSKTLNIGHYSKGIYFVNIRVNDKEISKKFIKY